MEKTGKMPYTLIAVRNILIKILIAHHRDGKINMIIRRKYSSVYARPRHCGSFDKKIHHLARTDTWKL